MRRRSTSWVVSPWGSFSLTGFWFGPVCSSIHLLPHRWLTWQTYIHLQIFFLLMQKKRLLPSWPFLSPGLTGEAPNLPSYREGHLTKWQRGWGCALMAGCLPTVHKALGLIHSNSGIIIQKQVRAWGSLRWFRRDHYPKANECMGTLMVVQKESLSKSKWGHGDP